MSSSHIPDDRLALPTIPADVPTRLHGLVTTLTYPVRSLGFWVGVATPVAYLPLLAGGLGVGESLPFVALLCLQALGLVVGRDHARESTDD